MDSLRPPASEPGSPEKGVDVHPLRTLLVLGALTTVSPLSIDLYLPAFQRIAGDLETTVASVAFSLSSYFIGMALGQLLYGPFLDRFGRKPPLYVGLAVYLAATAGCLVSGSIEALIGWRFLQAVGGCAASVAAMALIRDLYAPEEGARVFSKLMLILSVSPLFGPAIGGFVAAAWGWRVIFGGLVIVVAAVLAAAAFLLPPGRAPDVGVSLRPGAVAREYGSILRDRRFLAYALAGGFSFSGLFAYIGGAAALFMEGFGMSAQEFGLVFAVLSIGVVGGGQINLRLTRWATGERILRLAVAAQVGIAAVFLAGSLVGIYGLRMHVAIFAVYLACAGLTYPNAAALSMAPFERNAGSAAAMLGFTQMTVGALTSAAFGLISLPPGLAISVVFMVTAACAGLILRVTKPAI